MPTQTRINSIDLLRGIVMVIMALDHTRDFFHVTAMTDDPLNIATTTPALFFTRWITHFCAPVFVFLSGTSAFFQGLRKSKKDLSVFLLKRGLWLILIELTVITFGITFDIGYHVFILQVIWAIGISMVILSLVVWLPFPLILTLGLLILLGHNTLDFWEAGVKDKFPIWYSLLHRQGVYPFSESHMLMIFYPFLPWAGLMILGYCFGKYYLHDVMNRNRRTIVLGAALILFFVIARWINIYGDPLFWSPQKNTLQTLYAFINTQKYPPSLLYTCMTIGPALIVLGLIGDARNKLTNLITVYGRVPFFYYILHFYLIHIVSAIAFMMRGHTFKQGLEAYPDAPFKFIAPGEGYSLGFVYLVWLAIVISLYPLCKWFSEYKMKHKDWWLSYL